MGCEDKCIRIFTRDTARQDKGEDLKEYEEACKQGAQTAPVPEMSSLEEFSTQI